MSSNDQNTASFIDVDAAVVKMHCEKQLAYIEYLRAWLLSRQVFAEAHRERWLRKPIGYEKAFEALSSIDIAYATLSYGAQESQCKALILLAENGNPVHIAESAAWIFKEVNQ